MLADSCKILAKLPADQIVVYNMQIFDWVVP